MSRTTFEVNLSADVAAAGTFAVPYDTEAQADFVDGQTVEVSLYGTRHTCAVTFGATEATVTWPAGKTYPLPAGTYYIDFDLLGGDDLREAGAKQAANQAAVTDSSGGTADGTVEAVPSDTLANNAAAANNNFAELAGKYNSLVAAMKSAGIMVAD